MNKPAPVVPNSKPKLTLPQAQKIQKQDKDNVNGVPGTPGSEQPPPRREFKLDYTTLENDLQKELDSDRLYWIRNDAKIRAVQTPGTYEDFRQKVLGAHLKPLAKKDTEGLDHNSKLLNKVIWNKGCDGSGIPSPKSMDDHAESMIFKYEELFPKNIHEFKNQWKELTYSSTITNTPIQIKLVYLKKLLDSKTLEKLFHEDVPLEILPSLLDLFAKVLMSPEDDIQTQKFDLDDDDGDGSLSKSQEVVVVLDILNIISESKRFDFTKIFLTIEDIKNLGIIFEIAQNQLKAQNPKLMDLLPILKRKYL